MSWGLRRLCSTRGFCSWTPGDGGSSLALGDLPEVSLAPHPDPRVETPSTSLSRGSLRGGASVGTPVLQRED